MFFPFPPSRQALTTDPDVVVTYTLSQLETHETTSRRTWWFFGWFVDL